MTPYRAIFVDEQPEVLAGLQRLLRPWRETWSLEFFATVAAAEAAIALQPPDVLVTEARLTSTSALAFLERVQELAPETTRVVLTGFPDADQLATLMPVAHQILHKPCPPEQIIATLQRGCALSTLLLSERVRLAVRRLTSLPPIPGTYAALQRVASDPASGLSDLAAVVRRDPALAAEFLRLVNSVAFGLQSEITSIERAVSFLGTAQVRALTLQCESRRAFAQGHWPTGFDPEAHQLRAVRRAQLAQALVAHPRDAETAYIAGLLLDIGELAMAARLPGDFRMIREHREQTGLPQCEAETLFLGADHTEIGGALLYHWHLPTPVVEAVTHHHQPSQIEGALDHNLCVAVHLADCVEQTISGTSDDRERLVARLDPELRDRLDWDSFCARGIAAAHHIFLKQRKVA